MKVRKEYIGIRLKPTTLAKLNIEADKKELCLSELIREILENYVNRM